MGKLSEAPAWSDCYLDIYMYENTVQPTVQDLFFRSLWVWGWFSVE